MYVLDSLIKSERQFVNKCRVWNLLNSPHLPSPFWLMTYRLVHCMWCELLWTFLWAYNQLPTWRPFSESSFFSFLKKEKETLSHFYYYKWKRYSSVFHLENHYGHVFYYAFKFSFEHFRPNFLICSFTISGCRIICQQLNLTRSYSKIRSYSVNEICFPWPLSSWGLL